MRKIKYLFHFSKIMFFFIFVPSRLYKIYYGSKLMSANQRINLTNNPYDDFILSNHPILCDEINIVLRGQSFNKNSKINKLLPTFVVNPDNKKVYSQNEIFITSDGGIFEDNYNKNTPIFFVSGGTIKNNNIFYREFKINKNKFKLYNKLNNKKIVKYLLEKHMDLKFIHRSKTCNLQVGSSISCIIFLSKIARKTNIYGWDIYIDNIFYKKPNVIINSLLFFKNSGTYRYDIYSNFAVAILNTYYAYRLNKLNNIKIHGHIKFFFNKINILKRIEKIIYKIK